MYGTRRAAHGWHGEYFETLEKMGFQRAAASACVFWHPQRRLASSVHGGDLITAGAKEDLDWCKQELQKGCELNGSCRLGPAIEDGKECMV